MDTPKSRVLVEAAFAAGSSDPVDAAESVLSILRPAIGDEASSLMMWDESAHTHIAIAASGYDDEMLNTLGDAYAESLAHASLRRSGRATRIRDMPRNYLDSEMYYRVLGSPGFGDGMSVFLFSAHQEYVGILHMSATAPNTFGDDSAELINTLRPIVSHLCNVAAPRHVILAAPSGMRASLMDDSGRVWEIEDCEPSRVAESDGFASVLDDFLRSQLSSTQGVWLIGSEWVSVDLTRAHHPFDRTRSAAMIRERPTDDQLMGLSPRELDILQGMAMGHSNHEIAEARWISPRTVTTHVEHILKKMDQRSRAGAVSTASRLGLLRLDGTGFSRQRNGSWSDLSFRP